MKLDLEERPQQAHALFLVDQTPPISKLKTKAQKSPGREMHETIHDSRSHTLGTACSVAAVPPMTLLKLNQSLFSILWLSVSE